MNNLTFYWKLPFCTEHGQWTCSSGWCCRWEFDGNKKRAKFTLNCGSKYINFVSFNIVYFCAHVAKSNVLQLCAYETRNTFSDWECNFSLYGLSTRMLNLYGLRQKNCHFRARAFVWGRERLQEHRAFKKTPWTIKTVSAISAQKLLHEHVCS